MTDQQNQAKTEAPAPQAPPPPVRVLSQEERNDLRKFVLGGGQLDLEQAKAVIETARAGRGVAAMAAEAKPKGKGKGKKPGMTDADFNASLDAKLGI